MSRTACRAMAAAMAAAFSVACRDVPRGADGGRGGAVGEGAVIAAEAPRTYAAGHFGLGRPATAAQLAAWDRDIGPEGAELPPGRGTVRAGAEVYRTQCASCHGSEGQGIDPLYPALVGRDAAGDAFDFASNPKAVRTIGNYWPYATTLYDYIRRAMPLYTPGSLSADDTYAVVAYLLAANRVIPDSATLDAAALRAVVMPARDRFVADDRSPTRP